MSTELLSSSSLPAAEPSSQASTIASPRRGVFAQLGRGWVFVWKLLIGVFLTQSILGAIMVIGWTMRVMQRSVLKCWWKQSSARASGGSFESWLRRQPIPHEQSHWPNWVLRQNYGAAPDLLHNGTRPSGKFRSLASGVASSLWRNLKLGLQGMFAVGVFTLPGCALWLFSWYDGWNNSFNKGYEQAPVGPLLGIAGIVWFIAAMLYVPMAHARHAATGQWRAFFEFRLVWGLIRRRWISCLLLAVGFSLLSIPVTIMKTAPYFFAMGNSFVSELTPEQALDFLNLYFLGCAFVFLAAWLFLRCWMARIYGRALLKGLQQGEVSVAELGDWERRELNRLDLIQRHPPRSRHVLVEVAAGTSAGLWRFVLMGGTCLIWFTFIAQIYIAEFLMYHPVHGWLNQPLVQLPWFRYIPPHLQAFPFAELLITCLVLILLFGGAAVGNRLKSWLNVTRRHRHAARQTGDTAWTLASGAD